MLFGIASVLFRKSRCKALGPNTSEIVAKVAKVVFGQHFCSAAHCNDLLQTGH
jgi:hypothetical protein